MSGIPLERLDMNIPDLHNFPIIVYERLGSFLPFYHKGKVIDENGGIEIHNSWLNIQSMWFNAEASLRAIVKIFDMGADRSHRFYLESNISVLSWSIHAIIESLSFSIYCILCSENILKYDKNKLYTIGLSKLIWLINEECKNSTINSSELFLALERLKRSNLYRDLHVLRNVVSHRGLGNTEFCYVGKDNIRKTVISVKGRDPYNGKERGVKIDLDSKFFSDIWNEITSEISEVIIVISKWATKHIDGYDETKKSYGWRLG